MPTKYALEAKSMKHGAGPLKHAHTVLMGRKAHDSDLPVCTPLVAMHHNQRQPLAIGPHAARLAHLNHLCSISTGMQVDAIQLSRDSSAMLNLHWHASGRHSA
eukprot:1160453-Pelagomonas_calceolata.AAC.9